MKLYIIRHGETEWNTLRKMQGQTDIPLNKNGIELAKKVGINMKNIKIDYIISSPLKRAVVTAQLVTEGKNIPIITDNRLIEMSFGSLEGKCVLNPDEVPPEFNKEFLNNPMYCATPTGGESFKDVIARTKNFYDELCNTPKYKDANILISTHGAAGRCLLSNFYEDKEDIWRGCIPPNCSMCVVEIKNNKATVLEKDVLKPSETSHS